MKKIKLYFTEEEQMAAVRHDPINILYCENPSEKNSNASSYSRSAYYMCHR